MSTASAWKILPESSQDRRKTESVDEILLELPVSQIEIDPNQPRKELGDLESLKRSIEAGRILQPPVVTPVGPDRYCIVVGGRRYRAAVELGHSTIWVIVRTVEEQERLFLQMVENLQREDLGPFEQAECFRRLMDQHGLSEEELGEKVGKSQDYVSKMLTIAEGIPAEIRTEYYATSRNIRPSVLLEIARAESLLAKRRMWEQARNGCYTVKQARAERAGEGAKGGSAASPPAKPVNIPVDGGNVIVQCNHAATRQRVLEMLREALKHWEKIVRYEEWVVQNRAKGRTQERVETP